MDGTSEAVFRDLFDRHHRRVPAYLLRRANREVAFDAAEDVFLVAWRRLSEIPPDDRALPWLYGVARRVLANHRRSAPRFVRLTQRVAAQVPDPRPGPDSGNALVTDYGPLGDDCAWVMAFDPSGAPLVAGACGVLRLEGDEFVVITPELRSYMDMAVAPDGTVWLADVDGPVRSISDGLVIEHSLVARQIEVTS